MTTSGGVRRPGQRLGRRILAEIATIVTPDTILRWRIDRAEMDLCEIAAWATRRASGDPPSRGSDGDRQCELGQHMARRAWARVIAFFAFPLEIRRVIYTTNALESVHAQLRKIIKTRGHFPNGRRGNQTDWLAVRNITAQWERRAHLAPGDESIRDSLRRSLAATDDVKCTSAWTPPSLRTHRTRPQGLGKPHSTRFPTAPTRIIS